MQEDFAVTALGALAHPHRLRVFRALVVAGHDGRTPSVLADQLGAARNALSFHLKELAHAGLVTIEPRGRNLIYRADFARMNALLGYLTEHCCEGSACEVTAGGARASARSEARAAGRGPADEPAQTRAKVARRTVSRC